MTLSPEILIVDDDKAHRTMLTTLMGSWGYRLHATDDGDTAVEAVQKRPFDLILMDIRMVRMSGIDALDQIKAINPAIPVVIMTAYASVDTAVTALKAGAYDYLTKPLDFDKLRITLRRAMEHAQLRNENRELKARLQNQNPSGQLVGNSQAIQSLLGSIAQIAPTDATVLISGASGTGKELVASALHSSSPRQKGPFIAINCAAITETLLESELFGHEKGAFTGADRRKEGCFVRADGGTLFLDEVSEMPLLMQAKLLRVLQEREVVRVGGETVIKVDVRIITATNRDLTQMVKEKNFREDLYYRLNVVSIQVPLLTDRSGDIPLLSQHFLNRFAHRYQKEMKGFSPTAMDALIQYHWPGNVRELMNAIESALVLSQDGYIQPENLPEIICQTTLSESAASSPTPPISMETTLEEIEQQAIKVTLNAVGGNKTEAARRLGITRKTLHNKLKKRSSSL